MLGQSLASLVEVTSTCLQRVVGAMRSTVCCWTIALATTNGRRPLDSFSSFCRRTPSEWSTLLQVLFGGIGSQYSRPDRISLGMSTAPIPGIGCLSWSDFNLTFLVK